MVYDEIHGYAVTATNPFLDDSSPKDHVFVDEFACIGKFLQIQFHLTEGKVDDNVFIVFNRMQELCQCGSGYI